MIAKKIDDNQKVIVTQLRRIGASVAVTSMLGKGFPDIVVGFRNKNFLFELKDGNKTESRKRLTEDEQKFFNQWKGQVHKVETFDEILKVLQAA